MTSTVKLHFHLTPDEDGYPPVTVESLWAEPGSNQGEYVIDNVPFFARDATIGDTVLAREEDGQYWFHKLVSRSQNSLVRVVFFDQAFVDAIGKQLVDFGCAIEYLRPHNLMAVSVPGNVDLATVQEYLQAETSAGTIDYEEPILRQGL